MAGAVLSAQPRFERLHMVLGESDPAMASSLKDAIAARGVTNVMTCNQADTLFNMLDAEIVDLLVYDFDLLGDQFDTVMQRIRRKARGKNPFAIIVATIRDSGVETVQRLIGAGVDDLIRKPISVDRLFESINTFSHERKPFFVSYNYVGPTRRSGQRALEPANQIIRVPNTLRSRALEGVTDIELQRIVDNAVRSLDEKQLESCGIEIDVLATRVTDAYAQEWAPENSNEVRVHLMRLETVAHELRGRCKGTSFERVADLSTMVLAIAQRILRTPDASVAGVEVQLLAKLATAIRRALSVERHSVEVMQEIAKTVANYTRHH